MRCQALHELPGSAFVLQEAWAGVAGASAMAATRPGWHAHTPVELFEDPVRGLGPRPDHDLSDPAVLDRLVEAARSPSGPNVFILAPVCTSFCSWQRSSSLPQEARGVAARAAPTCPARTTRR